MRFYFIKTIKNIFRLDICLKRREWTFIDFFHPSSLQLSKFLEVLLEPLNENKRIYEKIQLGLHEALINAVKHGNLYDQKKSIKVRRVITSNWFIWQIIDEGLGTPRELRIPKLPEHMDAEGGRGLYIIYQSFDDIRWNKLGNTIQLACRRN